MKQFIAVLAALTVFAAGCAHRVAVTSFPVLADSTAQHDDQTGPSDGQVSNTEGIPPEFYDEDLDFLEEEIEEEVVRVADPLAPWNRMMFHFNDKFYFWVLKPVARGYKAVIPTTVRIGVQNFFNNLTAPLRFVNSLLQVKGKTAATELGRFLVNSVFGVVGFYDFAKNHGLPPPSEEDLGQTLGSYGIGNGIYIVWPFLGPSTLRDTIGMAGDLFLHPVSYVEPVEAAVGIRSFNMVNETSFRIGDYESLKEAAIAPYEAFRDAYVQHRKNKVEE